jgi:hypothetical protein
MDSPRRLVIEPPSGTVVPDQPAVELRAPVKVATDRPERDWLSIAWSAIFGIYCAAVLPLLGWAVVQAL